MEKTTGFYPRLRIDTTVCSLVGRPAGCCSPKPCWSQGRSCRRRWAGGRKPTAICALAATRISPRKTLRSAPSD